MIIVDDGPVPCPESGFLVVVTVNVGEKEVVDVNARET
jgi:hypothetical protein